MGEHFDEDVVFPLVAQAIIDICEHGDVEWADRDQVVVYLENIDDKTRLIKAGSTHWSDHRIYENMVDWWSACWTSRADTIIPYVSRFEQLRVHRPTDANQRREIWAYRPWPM